MCESPILSACLQSAVALGLGTVFILCVPSAVWTFTEQWDYATAVYFNTITLTTVGFGDYIAGNCTMEA